MKRTHDKSGPETPSTGMEIDQHKERLEAAFMLAWNASSSTIAERSISTSATV